MPDSSRRRCTSTSAAALGTVFASVTADTHTGVVSGVLADNGGPVQTVALAASLTNPALDAGDDTLAGVGRPRNGYMWQAARAAHVSFRDYGEMTIPDPHGRGQSAIPSLAGLWDQSLFSTIMLQTANDGVVSGFSRLETMCLSVRPIERAMREPRMDPQSTVFPAQPCRP